MTNSVSSKDRRLIDSVLRGEHVTGDAATEFSHVLTEIHAQVAAETPEPSVVLAAALEDGLPDGVAPRAATGQRASRWAPAWARLASLGLGAKLALGAGVAAAGVTGAGAAGVLPDPAQNAVATIVNNITPFEFPGGGNSDFGERVSTDANDPDSRGVDGREIADEASDGKAGGTKRPADPPNDAPGQIEHEAESAESAASEAPGQQVAPEELPTDPPSDPPSDTYGHEVAPDDAPSDAPGSHLAPDDPPVDAPGAAVSSTRRAFPRGLTP